VRVLAKSCSPNAIRCLAEIPQCWATSHLSLKSLVWYRPEEFDRLSLEVPATLSELEEMVVEMREQGATPWCFGLEAQGATGWAATDWIEDMVLRMSGPDIYERWMAGDVAFSDPAIREPFEAFRSLVLVPGSVAGGIPGVLRTSVSDSASGLFGEPADCVLHRQASFAFTWFPQELQFGPDGDIDFFVLPGIDETEAPLVVGSTVAVAFDDRPAVEQVMAYLATPESTRVWAEAGGHLTPHNTSAADDLPEADQRALDLLLEASVIQPDASDAMKPEIGSDLLWQEITRWVTGTTTYDQFAATLDEAISKPN